MKAIASQPMTIVGMSTLAVQGALVNALVPEFQASTGATVKLVFDPTQVLLERIGRGERADFIVAISSDIQALADKGVLCADKTFPLVRTAVGMAVSGNTEAPPLETIDQLKAALTGARSVAYSRTGASGIYFSTLLHRLGIADAVNSRATIIEKGFTGECVTQGTADLAIQQLSELAVVPGIRIAGPLPAEVGHYTDFSIGVFRDAANHSLLDRFLDYVRNDAAREAYRNHGLQA